MKKQDLLNMIDHTLLERLFGFCYARTIDSYEAEELCSDIVFALVKTAQTDGNVQDPYAFLWRIARNVYADFCEKQRRYHDAFDQGDPDNVIPYLTAEEPDDQSAQLLEAVYRRIAFLTKAYREVMILYYLDGCSTAEIARRQKISETAVRQRLFSARRKIKDEVETMQEQNNRPIALDTLEYDIWGTGNPGWSDPRSVCTRQLSKHIVWLCRQKPMRAAEIADILHVPTVYVEEELEILTKGSNGRYGMLRRLDNGAYLINFILLDHSEMAEANQIYKNQMPMLCRVISDFIEVHKKDYLAFPYRNKTTDWNLILWQQLHMIANTLSGMVGKLLAEKYFADVKPSDRPFSIFGFLDDGKSYGNAWDGADAENICGFSKIRLENIHGSRIKPHFYCGLNLGADKQLQLALRAIDGLSVDTLTEEEQEQAAKAIECGYLYRDGDLLYTKILVCSLADREKLFDISKQLSDGYFDTAAEQVAEQIAAFIRKTIPKHLLEDWRFANSLANMPVLDALMDCLIEQGLLTPPEDGIGAEGCWMSVEP